ncbi:hypothetical protein BH09PSE6_BH09PSE6_17880 [soil metagenome]
MNPKQAAAALSEDVIEAMVEKWFNTGEWRGSDGCLASNGDRMRDVAEVVLATLTQQPAAAQPVAFVGMPADVEEMREAAHNLAMWLSAALDDESTCQEYRDAINAWFDTGMPFEQTELPSAIYRATRSSGDSCHFGNRAVAKAWAGSGTVVEATFPTLASAQGKPEAQPQPELAAEETLFDRPASTEPLIEQIEKILGGISGFHFKDSGEHCARYELRTQWGSGLEFRTFNGRLESVAPLEKI